MKPLSDLRKVNEFDEFDEFAMRIEFDLMMHKLLKAISLSHLKPWSTIEDFMESDDELYEIYKNL